MATNSERHAQGSIVARTKHIIINLEHSGIESLLWYAECKMCCIAHSFKQTRFIGHSISSSISSGSSSSGSSSSGSSSSSSALIDNSPVTAYYVGVAIVAINTTGKH